MTLRTLALSILLICPAVGVAKGNIVTVGQTITGLELPWTTFRGGDSIFVKAAVDIAGTCAAMGNPDSPMLMQTDGSFAEACSGGPATCAELLQDAFWRDGSELRFVHDETGVAFSVRLHSCGMGLCGQGTVPEHAPTGSWSTVEISHRDDSPVALGDLMAASALTVENASEDRAPPTILAVSPAVGSVPPTYPGLVVRVQDDFSGVTELTARLDPFHGGSPSDGHVLDAVLRCAPGAPGEPVDCVGDRVVLDRSWLNAASSDWNVGGPVGSYYVRSISGRDRAGRYMYWEPPELQHKGVASLSHYAVTLVNGAAVPTSVKLSWELLAAGPKSDDTPVKAPTADLNSTSDENSNGAVGSKTNETEALSEAGELADGNDGDPKRARAALGCSSTSTSSLGPAFPTLLLLVAAALYRRRTPLR